MASVGVLYLLFEASILALRSNGGLRSKGSGRLSRVILGIQVGLIVLAMIVTSSSISSLQAKRGLPVGNQVVGWLVLGERHFILSIILNGHTANLNFSQLSINTFLVHLQHKFELFSSPDHRLSHLLTHLRHPYHLLRRALLLFIFCHTYYLGPPRTSYIHIHQC